MNVSQYLGLTVYDLLPDFDSCMTEVLGNLAQAGEVVEERLVAIDVLNDFGNVPEGAKLFGDPSGLITKLVNRHYGVK